MATEAIDRMMTLAEVAEAMNVTQRHVYRLIAAGEFPQPIRVGRCVRVPLSEFRAYLERLKQERRR